MKRKAKILAVGLGFAATLAMAQVYAGPPSTENEATGAIGVFVTDIHANRVEGAKVVLTSNSTDPAPETKITDEDGTTFFSDLKPGPYVVVATHPDFGEGKRRTKVFRFRKTCVNVVVRN